jgi:hypothetical protein
MERYYSGRQPAIIITTQRDESQRPTEIGSFHTVVLLGAGASFGSDDPKLTPPLGKALFDALVATTGVASECPEDLKAMFRDNFELGMAAYYSRTNARVARFQIELARYLVGFVAKVDNAYVSLISGLGPKGVLYSSLNYDLLIEDAAGLAGYSGVEYSTGLAENRINVLKLHGSSNFWPDLGRGQIRGLVINGYPVDVEANNVDTLTREQTLERCASETDLGPVIAMYAEGKNVKTSPRFVDEQQRMWLDALTKARRVFNNGCPRTPY